MRKLIVILAALTLAVTVGSIATNAQTQIGLGSATFGSVDFTYGGSLGTLAMCSSSCSLADSVPLTSSISNAALAFITSGTYTLGFNPTTLTSSSAFPNFTVSSGGGGTLTFTDTSLATVTLALQLTLVKDGTSVPNLLGTYVASATGDLIPLFANPNGTFFITLSLPCVLDTLSINGCPSSATENASFIFGSASATPEPATMLLFGSGLVLLGALLRRSVL